MIRVAVDGLDRKSAPILILLRAHYVQIKTALGLRNGADRTANGSKTSTSAMHCSVSSVGMVMVTLDNVTNGNRTDVSYRHRCQCTYEMAVWVLMSRQVCIATAADPERRRADRDRRPCESMM